jgi:hypothetical protein
MRRQLSIGRWAATMCAVLLLTGAAPAQQFSADLVGVGETAARGKLHVADDKVRIETHEVVAAFFVVDPAGAYLVKPQAGIFMDAKQSSLLAQIFVPLDPENPCARWQTAARISGAAENGGEWRCERAGSEAIDGRETVTWRAVSPQNRTFAVWIDRALRIPLRIETEQRARFELRDIREAPQPAELFTVPAGFQKFDPQKLIDRIKQSDVWVEPVPPE